MSFAGKGKKAIFLAAILLLLFSGPVSAQVKPVELKFTQPPAAGTDASRTLQSLVKVRDIGEQYATGGLYLITHYGDRGELLKKENQKVMDHAWINETWRFCSAFSTRHGNSVTVGHNWDNQPLYNVPDASLREKCWRYKSMAETLEKANGKIDWQAGMRILQDVAQKGTTWSVVYSLPGKELYFSVYQKWVTVYHLKPF
jgi:hypothetical protein